MTQPQIYGTAEHPYSTLPETEADRAWPEAGLGCRVRPADALLLRLGPVPWADLISLDLSLFDKPGGKQALADKLKWCVGSQALPVGPTITSP
jgi:hypothetical protein